MDDDAGSIQMTNRITPGLILDCLILVVLSDGSHVMFGNSNIISSSLTDLNTIDQISFSVYYDQRNQILANIISSSLTDLSTIDQISFSAYYDQRNQILAKCCSETKSNQIGY